MPPIKPIRLNVGGTRFEVSPATLQSAGDASLLARLASPPAAAPLPADNQHQPDLFLDRDPELFKDLLFVLRSKRLPAKPLDINLLIDEALYYGMLEALRAAMASCPLDGLDMEKTGALLVNGRDFPSALCCGSDGSLCLGHGAKITFYDWALRRQRTTLTELQSVESLYMISDTLAAVGDVNTPGVHIYDVVKGRHTKSFMWADALDPRVFNPTVHAITASSTAILVSFSSAKAGDNTITIVDPEKLEIIGEIGRQRGLSVTASNKLGYMDTRGLLVAGSTSGGAFGHTGHLRLFDARSHEQIFEWKEPNMQLRPNEQDSFADWVAVDQLDAVFKIGFSSGELEMLELRMMKEHSDPWLQFVDTRPSLAKGETSLLAASGNQVFCSQGDDIHVWSEVPLQSSPDKEYFDTSFRMNLVHPRRNMGLGHTIKAMEIGGDRLFVARKELQGVEVWATKRLHKQRIL